jgi:surface polysaccharide O-acyltransferase-like enzyme
MKIPLVSSSVPRVVELEKVTAAARSHAATRIFFVDSIRIFLTILVLLHHIMIIYAGSGSWIYNEGRQDMISEVVGTWFCTVNQSYFMGLFLLISAYFVPCAYERKGPGRFLRDRLVRLGIPLALYSWVIHPLLIYVYLLSTQQLSISFWEFFPIQYFSHENLLGPGPLWFVETLLIFSFVYVLWRLIVPASQFKKPVESAFPRTRAIFGFALLAAIPAFLIRLWLPVGWSFQLLNLQFPFFAQYIALFAIGIIAYQRNWLLGMPESAGRRWLWIGIIFILLFPVIAIAGGAVEDDTPFRGGWHWQSVVFALYESLLCVSLCIGVVYLFRRFAGNRNVLQKFLADNAYTAYIIHAPIITLTALALRSVELHPLLKFSILALISLPVCFILSALIRKIPLTQKFL